MQAIKLNRGVWEIDTSSPLGSPGGFGEVFRGRGESGDVAIKRLKMTASHAAHRELQVGKSLSDRRLKYVVPIIDYGQDADSDRYFLVMPICDRSLQDEIKHRGRFTAGETIKILLAILSGLKEAQDITHRDIKPPNILMHDSVWKIADFGIAKFVEDSTSLETLRNSLTPLYAAPEQWQLKRPSGATDIYATGCIAHTLITGKPPFSGDLRDQHLNIVPPLLNELPANVRSTVALMLRKNAESRPQLDRCIEVFLKAQEIDEQVTSGVGERMAEAVGVLAIEQAKREANNRAKVERKQNRELIFIEAARELNQIKGRLFHEIKSHAENVMGKGGSDTGIVIGSAELIFDTTYGSLNFRGIKRSDSEESGGEAGWGVHKRRSSWDFIALATISIKQNSHKSYKRSANIVFGKPNESSEYRWYEVAFWSFSQESQKGYPFSLEYAWDIDGALSIVSGTVNQAYDPMPIDGENEDSFIEYWMDMVVQAMVGNLTRPSTMPMNR
jgi:serine/threonine-protein kinase